MSPEMGQAAVAVLAAVLCGTAGLVVTALVGRLPEPEPHPDYAHEGPKQPYAEIAGEARVRVLLPGAAAVAGALVGWAVGWVWPLLVVLPVVPVGVALAVIDWRTRLLPTRLVLPTTGLALVLAGVAWLGARDTDALVTALLGLVGARSFFWLLWRVRSSGMGFGDVRLAALLGLVLGQLGWGELLVGLYAGFLLFGVPGLLLALVRRDRGVLRTAYPFGPFLLAGALVGVLVGDPLWSLLLTP